MWARKHDALDIYTTMSCFQVMLHAKYSTVINRDMSKIFTGVWRCEVPSKVPVLIE